MAAWLLDVLPPCFRHHPVLRPHPAALAPIVRHQARGSVDGARDGYRAAQEPAGLVPPHAVDELLTAYRAERFKLAATARAAELVERALRDAVPHPGR